MSAPDHPVPVLRILALHKPYGRLHVSRDIDLTVARGENVVARGLGTGLNHDIRDIDEIRRDVGMVFQPFGLFFTAARTARTHQFLSQILKH